MKDTLGGFNSRLDEAENQISNLENKGSEHTQSEQQKEKKNFKNENSLRDLWDNIKCVNICIIGLSEGEESQQGTENLFEIVMTGNFLNPVSEKDPQIWEVQSHKKD